MFFSLTGVLHLSKVNFIFFPNFSYGNYHSGSGLFSNFDRYLMRKDLKTSQVSAGHLCLTNHIIGYKKSHINFEIIVKHVLSFKFHLN